MTVIKVPRPPKSAYDPSRSISSLLKMQIEHLHEAERRLPTRYRSEIYPNAIKTESEAAEYVRLVTEGIHRAHSDSAVRRGKKAKKRTVTVEIAATSDRRDARKLKSKARGRRRKKR
jgi:hypothetical protein